MRCPHCNATVDGDTIFCGNCGKQIMPLQPGETVISYATQADGNPVGAEGIETRPAERPSTMYRPPSAAPINSFAPPSVPQSPQSPQSQRRAPATDKPRHVDTPPPRTPSGAPIGRPPGGNFRRIALIAALILVIVAGGTVGLISLLKNTNTPVKNTNTPGVVAAHASGQVAFIDNQNSTGHTDALKIGITGLGAPPTGSQYDAWLVNGQSEQAIALGTLVAKNGQFSVSYAGDSQNGKPGTNLLGAGDKLEITLEQGNVTLPTGKIILAGTFPPKAFVHIKHLLFSFPTTPGKIGLLVGVLNQAQLLNAQAVLLQSAVANQNQNAIPCLAQSIIDITEGTQGAHYQPLPATCANQNITAVGDGFGLLGTNGYISTASQHASLAATQTDSTDNIRLHAHHVEIAMTNINGWVTTVEQDALNLLTNPGNTTKVQEMVTLSDHAFHGVDIDGDESIDPVPGEAGAVTGYIHGQLMATLPLVSVA